MQQIKSFFRNRLIVLVIGDHPAAEIRGDHLEPAEVFTREG